MTPPGPRPLPSALAAMLDVLRCPVCGGQLSAADGSLRCPSRHTFNVARGGYASLLAGTSATSGDDDEMARARDRFLSGGAYAPIRDLIARMASGGRPDPASATVPAAPAVPAGTPDPASSRVPAGTPAAGSLRTVLDAGCGTGYYLAGVLDQLPAARGLGLDTSTRALRFAARTHERAAAASWDVFAPFPLRDASVDVLLNVFAPRNPGEFARVLRPGGTLVVVRPAPDHLEQLRAAIPQMVALDPRKEERLHDVLDPLFTTEHTEQLRFTVSLSPADARDLVGMTPSARHVSDEQLANAAPAGELAVSISVVASSHRARAGAANASREGGH